MTLSPARSRPVSAPELAAQGSEQAAQKPRLHSRVPHRTAWRAPCWHRSPMAAAAARCAAASSGRPTSASKEAEPHAGRSPRRCRRHRHPPGRSWCSFRGRSRWPGHRTRYGQPARWRAGRPPPRPASRCGSRAFPLSEAASTIAGSTPIRSVTRRSQVSVSGGTTRPRRPPAARRGGGRRGPAGRRPAPRPRPASRLPASTGAPRARQPVVPEEADRDVRVADVGRQQLHGPYRSSRSCENCRSRTWSGARLADDPPRTSR